MKAFLALLFSRFYEQNRYRIRDIGITLLAGIESKKVTCLVLDLVAQNLIVSATQEQRFDALMLFNRNQAALLLLLLAYHTIFQPLNDPYNYKLSKQQCSRGI